MSSSAAVRLEVFIDFVCPWCYLAHGVVEQLRRQRPFAVQWQPFPLQPSTPPQGMLLSELFGGADVSAMHERIYALMDELQLPYARQRDRLYNTRKAQELLLWAQAQDAGDALVAALFRSYFVEVRNLAEQDVLLEAAASAGLDTDAALAVLQSGSQAAGVDASWQRARQLGLNGVPAFVAAGYQFSGHQPATELARFLDFLQSQS
jgi:predicted DsbA family dithiol-disulfide isomerase